MLITVVRVARVLRADIPLVEIELTNGERRSIDLTPYLAGKIFEPVRTDPAYFAQVQVDPDFHTLRWPNGADVDPDVLLGQRPLA